MSAAEDESEDTDLPREMSDEDFQDAQIDRQQPSRGLEDDISSLHSDDFIPEACSSQDSEYQSVPTRSQDAERLQVSNRRVVPAIAHSPFAEEESYFTRPNRYFGPDSTWLSWTKEDRLVPQTLDRLRSQDLSIHLFNSYALKRRGQAVIHENQRDRNGKGRGKGRARSPESENDSDGQRRNGFVPPRTWTAWPLASDQVPREDQLSDVDDFENYKMVADARPSATLEDCIIATTTRLARERWRGRKWAPESRITAPSSSKQSIKLEQGTDAEMDASQQLSARSESEAAGTLSTETDSGSEVFESQPWGGDEQPSMHSPTADVKSEADSSDLDFERRPTPIADEDAARYILLPSTRHILSKLDDLLMGLHHARQAYATTTSRASKVRKSDDSKDSETTENEQSNIGTPQSRKRKRSAPGPSNTLAEPKAKHSRRSKDPLGLRDWSDVIGMAALTGWEPTVVQRASERCANLFGENMMFRTFFEGDPTSKEKSYFTEDLAVSGETSEPEVNISDEDSHMIPIRTSRACKTCTRLKEKCEPANPAEGTGPCKRCLMYDDAGPCSGITAALKQPPNAAAARVSALMCPHPTCERHIRPFKKRFHLQRHLDGVHGDGLVPLVSSPTRPSSSGGEYLSAPASEIVCPILTCPRHERGFKRGHHLYRHISNMHPEVDVAEVKKLERTRRGDKRGKWSDERRKRPRSRSRSKSVGIGKGTEGGGSDSDG